MPRSKTARTRNAILGAATRAFDAKDFHDVLTDDIAATAGIGKATLYRYFGTKEDLYFATLMRGFDELDAALAAGAADGTSHERLRHVAREVLKAFWNRPSFYTLMHRNEIHFQTQHRLLQVRRRRVLQTVRAILARGVAHGEIRRLDAPIAAELFMGLVRAALFRRRPSDTPDRLVETLVGIFLDGAAA